MPERPRRMVQVLLNCFALAGFALACFQLHFGIDREFMVFLFCISFQKFQPAALVGGDGTFYRDIGDSFQMIDEVCFSQKISSTGVFQHVWTFFQVS